MNPRSSIVGLAALCATLSFAAAAEAQNARQVYIVKCAPCHGDTGGGDGPGADRMLPRPRVFADNSNFKFRSTPNGQLPLTTDLVRVITNGIPGTAMPAFDHLPEATRRDLARYVESLSSEFADPDNQEERVAMPIGTPPEVTPEMVTKGRGLYKSNKCHECHGEEGRGDATGWNEKRDAWNNPIVPANLTRWHQLRNGAEMADLFRTTLTGLNGTPMPNTDMPAGDRWALAAYLHSIQQPRRETPDQVILARHLAKLPTSIGDRAWNDLPQSMFPLVGQVVQKPRLFWPAVTEIFVRAAYDDESVVLLLEWDDRDRSTGTNLEEFPAERDPITEIFVNTDYPDQLAVQFPAGTREGEEKPYFLWGDREHEVNLWWWSSAAGGVRERNASGEDPSDQGETSQGLVGTIKYENGHYTMMVRRALTTDDAHDVQFEPGVFVPIAFNAWQGRQGEIGRRRAISTWYWLVLEPSVPQKAFILPGIVSGLCLSLLLFIVVSILRTESSVPRHYRLAFPVVTIASVGALVLYVAAPGTLAFMTNTVAQAQAARVEPGADSELRDVRDRQQSELKGYRWSDREKQLVKVPIDAAMQRVLEESRRGNQTNLVPAVGSSDQATMPPPEEAPPAAAPAPDAAPAPAPDAAAAPGGGPPPGAVPAAATGTVPETATQPAPSPPSPRTPDTAAPGQGQGPGPRPPNVPGLARPRPQAPAPPAPPPPGP